MFADGEPPTALRSALMSRVKGKNTRPELIVRRLVHKLGYRYRLHRRDLPGSPDIVLPRGRKVIFVHGCFWHRHPGCPRASTPKTREAFWESKLSGNVKRDAAAQLALEAAGWKVLVVWECETRSVCQLKDMLISFLA
jgi:DNA mismatch endonuclease (patch repair protein)